MIKHFGDGHYISVDSKYDYPKEYSTCKLCGNSATEIRYAKKNEFGGLTFDCEKAFYDKCTGNIHVIVTRDKELLDAIMEQGKYDLFYTESVQEVRTESGYQGYYYNIYSNVREYVLKLKQEPNMATKEQSNDK